MNVPWLWKGVVCVLIASLVPVIVASPSGFAEAPTRLTVQTYYTPGFSSARAFDHVLGEFHKKHPNVQVRHAFIPFAELIPTILRQALAGDLPDVVFADNPDVLNLAQAGVFADITRLVQTWGQFVDFFLGSRYATRSGGKVYALHFSTNNLALYYNRDHFRRAGIAAPPRTWAELLETSQILAEKLRGEGVDAIGFSAIDSEEGTWQLLPFIWSNGGSLLELDGRGAVEALRLFVTLVQRGLAPRDVLTWTQTTGVLPQFIAGRLAMMINGPWVLPDLRGKLNYGIAPLPAPAADKPVVLPMGGEVLGLAATISPQRVEAAWALVRFFSEASSMAEFTVRAGRVPTRNSVIPLVVSKDAELRVFAEQARRALPRPAMGGDEKYTRISSITRRFMQQALSGLVTPEVAFQRASAEVRALFPTEREYQAAVSAARTILADVQGVR